MLKQLKAIILSAGLCAVQAQAAELMVSKAYAKANIPGADNSSAYMELMNHSKADVTLIDVKTTVAKKAELHTHEVVNDRMRMRQVQSVTVPAMGKLSFAPGGYHIMLIGLTERLRHEEQTTLTLVYSDGTEQTVTYDIIDARKQKKMKPDEHSGHGEHKMKHAH